MKKEIKKVPTIRFKEFTDDWEQRKLENWGTFYYGKSCPKWSITDNANIPCIRYGELYTKFGTKIDKIYSYTNMSPENLKFSKGKEVLIPRVGEDPMDYNHCTWLSMPNIAIGEMISVFNTENDPLFTATMFNATLQNEFACRVEGGSVTNLYFEKLKNIEVSFPKIDEQKKIGKYFDSLDNRITLHQRKLKQLQTLKKYFLQNMFPAKGEKVPTIRFKGFTGDWKTCKFGDVFKDVKSGLSRMLSNFDIGLPVIRANNICDGKLDLKSDIRYWYKIDPQGVNTYNYLVNKDDILINFINSEAKMGTAAYVEDIPCRETIYTTNILRCRTFSDINSKFIFFLTFTQSYKNYIKSITKPAINQASFTTVDFKKYKILIPDIKEQIMISNLLTHVDNRITLQQRKLDQLQSLKKFMLQNLFI